jgi:DNA-binding transcriptional ArsR family regulator
LVDCTPERTAAKPYEEATVAAKFTRIPKTDQLIASGVPTEAIPTYCALADHANNKTGECFPKMETLAKTLRKSVRTVQRHLHILRERGLVEFVERRRHKGRYSSYLYRVLHIVRTTGHGRRLAGGGPIYRGTKRPTNAPKPPEESREERREREARRRVEQIRAVFGPGAT